MKITTKRGLKKPEANDFYNIEDFNYNADKLDDHKHSTDDLTSGILPLAKGGTGAGTLKDAQDALGVNLKANADDVYTKSEVDDLINIEIYPGTLDEYDWNEHERTSTLFKISEFNIVNVSNYSAMQVCIKIEVLANVAAGNITNQFIGRTSEIRPHLETPLTSGATGGVVTGCIATDGKIYITAVANAQTKGAFITLGATLIR